MRSLFDLSGRTALVTGSSRGIGRGIAEALAGAGAQVVLNGRDAAVLASTADQLRAQGHRIDAACFDVADEAAVGAAVDDIESRVGPIDILFNNSGMTIRRPLDEFATDDWNRIMAVNLTGAFLVGRSVARKMIPRRAGKIVNVCSINSELARYSIAPYVTSKGGLKNLTRGMAIDWARHGIQVNAIGPGYVDTDLTAPLVADREFSEWVGRRVPLGRWGKVSDLHGAAIFLASAASDFITGQILYVDGGLTATV
ncbi:MAG TPA: SDR family oxidoreductase [Burkholderiaceae bacterium]|nr:SDR family oxidoreductase [Burkholderiaceae bacterium]